jgi:hypothetical protein
MPDVDWARWREVFREKLLRAERDVYDATLILFERKPRA